MLDLGLLLARVKNTGIFLGLLYTITFVLLLPHMILRRGNPISLAMIVLAMLAAVVLVHLFLNWVYLAALIVPAAVALWFFIVGAVIWVLAPLLAAELQLTLKMVSTFLAFLSIGGLSVDDLIINLSRFVERVGILMMGGAGTIWRFGLKNLKSLNQGALVTYLTALALFGVYSGYKSLSGAVLFLSVWLALYLRLKGEERITEQLALLFKVVASLALVIGLRKAGSSIELGALEIDSFFRGSSFMGRPANQLPLQRSIHVTYGYLLPLLGVGAIWWPKLFTRWFSQALWDRITKILLTSGFGKTSPTKT